MRRPASNLISPLLPQREKTPSSGEEKLPTAASRQAGLQNVWWLLPPGALVPGWMACLVLRAEGMLTWNWWFLTAPVWVPACALVLFWAGSGCLCLGFAVLGHLGGWKDRRRRRRDERVHRESVARMRTGTIHRFSESGRIEIEEAWKRK